MRICEICGSTHDVVHYKNEIYLCNKHRKQMIRHGKILEHTNREPNEIVEHDSYAELKLYNKDGVHTVSALIDIEDVEDVRKKRWCLNSDGYVVSNTNNNYILLHRYVMGVDDNLYVDHIFHNKLDNRKDQLRICTNAENCRNVGLPKNNTSGVVGVWYRRDRKKWVAEIRVNYEKIVLGQFQNFDDAVRARKIAEIKYFGDFVYRGDANG